MSRSQQSSQKREKEKHKQKKKKEKEERKLDRQNNSSKGKGFEAMIAYVDERGNFSAAPPDTLKKEELRLQSLSGADAGNKSTEPALHQGRVSYYNPQKNYGFIKDNATRGSVFFQVDTLSGPLKLNDTVSYNLVKGPKGATAENIKRVE